MSCALILGRCRRKVLLFDTGTPRNKSSHSMNGFLSRDGYSPTAFLFESRKELEKYAIEFREERIVKASKSEAYFSVKSEQGAIFQSKKLLLATGVVDRLPNIEGIHEYYGKGVHHCPYCDGWEVRDKPLAVYAERRAGALELSLKLKTWSNDITLFARGVKGFGKEDTAYLQQNGVKVLFDAVDTVEGKNGWLTNVITRAGHRVPASALFFSTRNRQHSDLAAQFNCTLTSKGAIRCNRFQETSVPGLFTAGDMARDMQLVIVAAAEGAKAGVVINTVLNKEARISKMPLVSNANTLSKISSK